MSGNSMTEALTLYRSGTLTLKQAAKRAGVSTSKLASELRARGLTVHEAAKSRSQ